MKAKTVPLMLLVIFATVVGFAILGLRSQAVNARIDSAKSYGNVAIIDDLTVGPDGIPIDTPGPPGML